MKYEYKCILERERDGKEIVSKDIRTQANEKNCNRT